VNRTVRAVLVSWLLFAWPGAFVATAQSGPPAQAPTIPLTILHTNDTHGHLLPFSYPTLLPAGSDLAMLKERTDIGGIARRATLVRQVREQSAARKTTVWLVDAGDFSDGTPMSTEYHGEADVAAMNAAGYDMATLGNHEFNNPLAQTKKLVVLARFPVLCANAVDAATGKPLAQESLVRNVGGVRIGVFGLITHEAATYPAAKEGVKIADEIETARRLVGLLRAQADIVIAISHAGEDVDNLMAQQVPGIDVIIGGHSHSRLPTGEFVWRSEDLKVNDVNGTVIVQAHQWGGEVGRLDLLFEKDEKGAWHVGRYRARLMPVTAAIPADPKVAAVVDEYWRPIASRYGEVLGQAEADFSSRGDDEAPYNLVADAVRETFGTEIEMENTGGVRAPLVKGQITRGDLVTLDPFNNTVMLFKVSGRDLKRILVQHRPAVSGLRYRVENRELVEATVNGRPIEDDRIYTGATNSYFAQSALQGIDTQDTKRARLDVVVEYVRKKGSLKPVYDGRRVVIGR
jgi:2',3'-cyclic-nucleotide 2'-phosphodiesterase (5'-nucleotidase family)